MVWATQAAGERAQRRFQWVTEAACAGWGSAGVLAGREVWVRRPWDWESSCARSQVAAWTSVSTRCAGAAHRFRKSAAPRDCYLHFDEGADPEPRLAPSHCEMGQKYLSLWLQSERGRGDARHHRLPKAGQPCGHYRRVAGKACAGQTPQVQILAMSPKGNGPA